MNDTTNDPNLKNRRCANGDDCITPGGPEFPCTREHFYFTQYGRPRRFCKACERAKRRQHHAENREHDNQRSSEYARNNRARYNLNRKNYHIRKANAVGDGHTLDQLSARYIEQDGCCNWCGVKVGLKFEIDHAIPLSRGGHDDISNVVVSCGKCNRSKGDKTPEEWREQQAREG